ncbi:putative PIN and TRAM-domain containing protein precursor [compost metagenome]
MEVLQTLIIVTLQGRPIFVDTSVLIDGRIIAVAQSGFIGDTLVIPRSVIGELQFLADNADHDKRSRARHGLDVVQELQQMPQVTVEILQDGSKAEEGVDERLLKLAKQYSGAVCTIDFNLNKVAQVESIAVLNVNELAQSLRMAYLPGEKMLLELVQKGQDSHQAVGYLADGTMVVVEHAFKQIGQTIEIEFIRSLQTAAGKMMFAKPTVSSAAKKQPVLQQAIEKLPMVKAAVKKKQTGRAPKPVAPVEPVSPAVFHSDTTEHRKVTARQQKNDDQGQPRQPRQQRSGSKQPQHTKDGQKGTTRPRQQRPKTSAQREAALIDLVDQQ